MAKSPPHPEVTQAFKLLKAGNRQAAGKLLRSYLASHKDDAEAWWLMSHVVTAPELRQKALRAVLQLDPTHERARAKLAELGVEPPPRTPPAGPPPAAKVPPAAKTAPPQDEPLPWQQPAPDAAEPAQERSQPPKPKTNPFTVPVDEPFEWEPPETRDFSVPEAEQAPPAGTSSVLDEEPDDSMFFDTGGSTPKPAPPRRAKALSSLHSAPPTPRLDTDTPTGAVRAGPEPRTSDDPWLDTGAGDDFDDDFDDSFPLSTAMTAVTPFEEFAAKNAIQYDPFTGEPVRNPFKTIPLSDDALAAPDVGVRQKPDRAAGRDAARSSARTGADNVLALAVVGFSVVVMVTFVLFALDEGGRIDLDIFASSANVATLDGGSFELEYPDHFNQRCRQEALGYRVCGIASQPFYNEVDLFVDPDVALAPGVISPGLSVIVMDVPERSPAYYNGSWAKTLYNASQQGEHFDPDAVITYNGREDITIDGYSAYYYRYTSAGTWNEAAWDLYIPHDGIVFWLRATFFGNARDRIPQDTVDAMIDSIDINP